MATVFFIKDLSLKEGKANSDIDKLWENGEENKWTVKYWAILDIFGSRVTNHQSSI